MLDPNKIWLKKVGQKSFGQKSLCSKKFMYKKPWVQKNFRSNNFFSTTISGKMIWFHIKEAKIFFGNLPSKFGQN